MAVPKLFDRVARGVAWRLHSDEWYWLTAIEMATWNVAVSLEMKRETEHGIDGYTRRVNAMHRKLRVPRDYRDRGLPLYREASDLVAVSGLAGRACLMTHVTRSRWLAMQASAAAAGITLLVRWGFRSLGEQAFLIRQELRDGCSMHEVLTRIAAPGYSEHHTGRALDIECAARVEEFERTDAFDWLCRNAEQFGFELSYPRDNPYGLVFEPWHWRTT